MGSVTLKVYRALGENARGSDGYYYSRQDYLFHKLLEIIGYVISLGDSSHSSHKSVKVNARERSLF